MISKPLPIINTPATGTSFHHIQTRLADMTARSVGLLSFCGFSMHSKLSYKPCKLVRKRT